MTTLYLCEKPSQGQQLAAALGAHTRGNGVMTGDGVAVTWCIGHVLEQAQPEAYGEQYARWDLAVLPITPSPWRLDVKASTKSQFNVVRAQLKFATSVVIATDADREGEVIAREVMDYVGYRGRIERLWLTAMDPASVRKGLKQLKPENSTRNLYHSGVGRSRADWLLGMNITRALTVAFGGGGKGSVLHCGRVQTAVLGLVVRREKAIASFVAKPYFVLDARFEIMGSVIPMDWQAPEGALDKDKHCVNPAVIDAVVATIAGKTGRVARVDAVPEREGAPLPYYLGEIQKEASMRFGMKPQLVLDVCQALYEKHHATTYPRTDCGYLLDEQWKDVPQVLESLVAVDAALKPLVALAKLDVKPRSFNSAKCTAHHGIVPTANASVRLDVMSAPERSIYELIRRRYIAQFLGDHLYTKTTITVTCEGEGFVKSGKTTTMPGWKRADLAASAAQPAKKVDDAALTLPACKAGDQAIVRQAARVAKKTEPPKRYTDGTLITAMESIDKEIDDPRMKLVMKSKEKAGIGTEATRANIIDNLFKRGYLANEKKSVVPTPRGMELIELLIKVSPQLVDPVLTAHWEEQLAQVEHGNLSLEAFELSITNWLKTIDADIKSKAGTMQVSGAAQKGTAKGAKQGSEGILCSVCGKGHMRQRNGSSGVFWGCSGYPECKNTMVDVEGKPVAREMTGIASQTPARTAVNTSQSVSGESTVCPTCVKGKLVLRNMKDNPRQFWGCSAFPACRHFQWLE